MGTPAYDLAETTRAMADLLEERMRDLARAQNSNLLDAHKVVELARRQVAGPVTKEAISAKWAELAGADVPGWLNLTPQARHQVEALVKHFSGLMAEK